MKSKKKKGSPARFQDESADKDFINLMNRLGVKELDKAPPEQSPPTQKEESNPVKFVDDDNLISGNQPAVIVSKYGKKAQNSRNISRRRRIKIAPGFIPDVELDLHGSTREVGIHKVEILLETCRRQKYQTALIITGRGLNSWKGEGILRKSVWKWLDNNQKHLKISCRWAPAFLGGKGAIIVFFN